MLTGNNSYFLFGLLFYQNFYFIITTNFINILNLKSRQNLIFRGW